MTPLLVLVTACGVGASDPPQARAADPAAPSATAGGGDSTTLSSHRPGAPLDVAEAAALLPSMDDAEQVTAPRKLPKERLLAEYCHDAGAPAERAEALAAELRPAWNEVAVQDVRDRSIVRAARGAYVLRATVSAGAERRCTGPASVYVRLVVFKPKGAGGLGRAGRRG